MKTRDLKKHAYIFIWKIFPLSVKAYIYIIFYIIYWYTNKCINLHVPRIIFYICQISFFSRCINQFNGKFLQYPPFSLHTAKTAKTYTFSIKTLRIAVTIKANYIANLRYKFRNEINATNFHRPVRKYSPRVSLPRVLSLQHVRNVKSKLTRVNAGWLTRGLLQRA